MKRAYGSGSVTMMGEKTARLRWRDRHSRRSRVVHDVTEAEAHAMMDAIMDRLADRGAEHTVESYGWQWLEDNPGRSDESSITSRFRKHIAPSELGGVLVSQLRPVHVRRFLDRLKKRGVGPAQRRHCANLLSAMMRDAVELEMATSNPVRAVRKPKLPPSRRKLILDAEQVEQLATMRGPEPLVLLLLVGLGVRPGELRGLMLEDDCGDHVLVWRSDRQKNATKTGDPRRVEVFGWGEVALQRWRALRPTLRIKRCNIETSPWLVPVPRGWFKRRDKLGAVLRELGVGHLKPHDMRGTWATHQLSGTWGEPWEVADVAAHIGDSIATTMKSYAHIIPSRLKRLANRTRMGHAEAGSVENSRAIPRRARQDSNLRPLASETQGYPLSPRDVEAPDVPSLARLADRFLRAVADDDPRALDMGVDLAAEVRRLEVAMSEERRETA